MRIWRRNGWRESESVGACRGRSRRWVNIIALNRLFGCGRRETGNEALGSLCWQETTGLRPGLAKLREDLFEGADQVVLLNLALPEGQRQIVGLVRRPELEDVGLAPPRARLVPVAEPAAEV